MPGQIRKNWSRAFEGLAYLAYQIQKEIMFSYIFYSHKSIVSVVNIDLKQLSKAVGAASQYLS